MKIDRLANSRQKRDLAANEIDKVGAFKLTGRVCGANCGKVCPECGALDCQCTCTPDCPDLPAKMSPEPEQYPIEAGIAALVFVLKRTGIFHPCWSCEGHLSPASAALWKIPQVWFYCDSTTHVRLLADTMSQFKIDGVIRAPWEVSVGYSDSDNADTTFILRPRLDLDHGFSLWQLQADAAAIAKDVEAALSRHAGKLKSQVTGSTP